MTDLKGFMSILYSIYIMMALDETHFIVHAHVSKHWAKKKHYPPGNHHAIHL